MAAPPTDPPTAPPITPALEDLFGLDGGVVSAGAVEEEVDVAEVAVPVLVPAIDDEDGVDVAEVVGIDVEVCVWVVVEVVVWLILPRTEGMSVDNCSVMNDIGDGFHLFASYLEG